MFCKTVGPKNAKILLVGEAPGCFTEDVEVLSTKGWINISRCSLTTQIAQYNSGIIEFVCPSRIIVTDYTGDVISLSGGINTTVTPNHKFMLYNRYHNSYVVEFAEELRLRYTEQSFICSGIKSSGVVFTPAIVKLIAAVQADGSYDKTGIRFEFSKQRKIDRLLEILHESKTSYRIGGQNVKGTFRLTIPRNDPSYWLIETLMPDKQFSWKILSLDNTSLNILIDELKYWDGHKDNRCADWTYFEYSSAKSKNIDIDIVQAIAHITGHKAVYGDNNDRVPRLTISKKQKIGVRSVLSKREHFSGSVYCLTVPSGNFLVRTNHEVFVSGNSDEDREGIPFVGYSGKTLNYLLQQSGISRSECLITNVARMRPPNNEIAFYFEDKKMTRPKPELQGWIDMLKQEILDNNPNIIVALGATALYALTGEKGLTSFRGYILPCSLTNKHKVIATYHPQAVNHDWKLHFTTIMDLRKALRHSEFPKPVPDTRAIHATVSYREFMSYLQAMSNFDTAASPLGLDIETMQPNSHVDIIGIADSPKNAYSFELIKDRKPTLSRDDEFRLWQQIAILAKRRRFVMHNGSYDAAVLMHNNGIYFNHFTIDTLIAAHVVWPECPRSLGYLASICLDVPAWKHTSTSAPTLYNGADVANTLGIWEVLEAELKKKNLMNIFTFEMSQVEPAMMLQLQGLKVNEEVRQNILTKTDGRIKELEGKLEDAIGKKINFSSPKQMQQLLYVDLELPVQFKRRKKATDDRKMTTDAEALKKLWLKTHNPILADIMELKKLIKLSTSFLSVDVSNEGRVHTCYNITGATMSRETKGFVTDDEDQYRSFGRWSSSKSIILPYGSGNLQNQPKKARKIFTADPGKIIVQGDLMQAEAVVVSYLINDVRLKNMFSQAFGKSKEYRESNGLDVHRITAATMFKKNVKDVSKDERTIGKTLRHGLSYSAGPAVLAARLDISVNDARMLYQTYHTLCPQLQLWQLRIQEELKRTRTLTNLLGRKHQFLDRWGDSLFRSAYSFIPQSTVGDLLNAALVDIYYNHPELNIILQLHDAIYCMVDEDKMIESMKIMQSAMLRPLKYREEEFIIDVDFSVGKSWGEMEEFDIYAVDN